MVIVACPCTRGDYIYNTTAKCSVWNGKNSAEDAAEIYTSQLFYKIFNDKHLILSRFENNVFTK
jgi:hypothetical protein